MAESGPARRPLTEYSDVNHQPPLWIASVFCPIASILFLGIRFYARSKNFKPETLWNIGVFVVASAHWACVYAALASGAGKDISVISQSDYFDAGRLIFTSRILLLVLEGLSRTFFLHFLRQIFHVRRTHRKAVWDWSNQHGHFKIYAAALLVHIGFVIAAPMAVSVGCRPELTLAGNEDGYCPNDNTRWIAVTIVTGISELIPLFLAIQSVRGLETNLRRKFDICVVLGSCRIMPLIIFILYTRSYLIFTQSGAPSLSSTTFLIYQQILVATSSLSLCIPVLRNFGSNFNNGGLGGILDGTGAVATVASKDGPPPTTNSHRSHRGGLGLTRLRSVLSRTSRRGHGTGSGNSGGSGRSFNSGLRSFADEPDKSADIGKLGQPGETEVYISSDPWGPTVPLRAAYKGQGYGHGAGVSGCGIGTGGGVEEVEMGMAARPESKDEGSGGETDGTEGPCGPERGSLQSGSSQRVILCQKEYEVRRS
ncbi:hypothetical protein C1H76_3834 [Elsinoe australis]|uniref:Rhodopsin domain-containing protein n=1 Tax=Elsinoe australis TaxID=40998 RepID=A0A4U7B552_9PEZI|nr:hypothetical protein C1H76_3834 [Elsinoe australis]